VELVEVAHVGHPGHAAAVLVLDQLHRLVQLGAAAHRVGHGVQLGRDVADRHVRTLPGERDGVRAALAAGAPGDQYDLAVELAHVLLLELGSDP
jgi:hypothetical protein